MRHELILPIDEATSRDLHVGDILYITGKLFTARDEAHRLMIEHSENGAPPPFDPSQMALFHCGPVVRQSGDGWEVVAAGPTTSMRMDLFGRRFLEMFGPRVIIGKGGMGPQTQVAMESVGAVYAQQTGGTGASGAKRIAQVTNVHWLEELGMPEAVWIFDVRSFGPLLVTMDSHGGNLHKQIESTIAARMQSILARIEG